MDSFLLWRSGWRIPDNSQWTAVSSEFVTKNFGACEPYPNLLPIDSLKPYDSDVLKGSIKFTAHHQKKGGS